MNVRSYEKALVPLAAKFDCGNVYLNQFLRSEDSLNPGIGKTYVFLSENNDCIIGYYNLCCGAIDQIENGNHIKTGGAVHIGYFALDSRFQHQFQIQTPKGTKLYLGDFLLDECLSRINNLRTEQIGAAFVTVASSEPGEKLYRRHEFVDLDSDMTFSLDVGEMKCIPLYLLLDF